MINDLIFNDISIIVLLTWKFVSVAVDRVFPKIRTEKVLSYWFSGINIFDIENNLPELQASFAS